MLLLLAGRQPPPPLLSDCCALDLIPKTVFSSRIIRRHGVNVAAGSLIHGRMTYQQDRIVVVLAQLNVDSAQSDPMSENGQHLTYCPNRKTAFVLHIVVAEDAYSIPARVNGFCLEQGQRGFQTVKSGFLQEREHRSV